MIPLELTAPGEQFTQACRYLNQLAHSSLNAGRRRTLPITSRCNPDAVNGGFSQYLPLNPIESVSA